MFNRVRVKSEELPEYRQEFLVYAIEQPFSYQNLKKITDTSQAAEAEGKKYIHQGDVLIKEQLTRTHKRLPKAEVCT